MKFMRRVPYIFSLGAALFSGLTGNWFGVVINLAAFGIIHLTNTRSDKSLEEIRSYHDSVVSLMDFMRQYELWQQSAQIVMKLKVGDHIMFENDTEISSLEGTVKELHTVGCIVDCMHGPEVVLYREIQAIVSSPIGQD